MQYLVMLTFWYFSRCILYLSLVIMLNKTCFSKQPQGDLPQNICSTSALYEWKYALASVPFWKYACSKQFFKIKLLHWYFSKNGIIRSAFRTRSPEMFCKKVSLTFSWNSRAKKCARVSFYINLQLSASNSI